RGERCTAQYHLIDHELAVVFTYGPRGGTVPRIRPIGAGGPLPHMSGQFADVGTLANGLQLCLGWQSSIHPARIGIGFVPTDVAHWRVGIERAATTQPHLPADPIH